METFPHLQRTAAGDGSCMEASRMMWWSVCCSCAGASRGARRRCDEVEAQLRLPECRIWVFMARSSSYLSPQVPFMTFCSSCNSSKLIVCSAICLHCVLSKTLSPTIAISQRLLASPFGPFCCPRLQFCRIYRTRIRPSSISIRSASIPWRPSSF